MRAGREQMRKTLILSLALGCLVSGCVPTPQRPPPKPLTADELLAFENAILDCELKAANRFDDGRREISELAEQVSGRDRPHAVVKDTDA